MDIYRPTLAVDESPAFLAMLPKYVKNVDIQGSKGGLSGPGRSQRLSYTAAGVQTTTSRRGSAGGKDGACGERVLFLDGGDEASYPSVDATRRRPAAAVIAADVGGKRRAEAVGDSRCVKNCTPSALSIHFPGKQSIHDSMHVLRSGIY